jgi:hypothetical protein
MGVWVRVCSGVVPVLRPVPGVWMRLCVPAVLAVPWAAAAGAPARPWAKAAEEMARMLTSAMEVKLEVFMMLVL